MSELSFMKNYDIKERDLYEKNYVNHANEIKNERGTYLENSTEASVLDDFNEKHVEYIGKADLKTTKQNYMLSRLKEQIRNTLILYRHEKNRQMLLLFFLAIMIVCFVFALFTM